MPYCKRADLHDEATRCPRCGGNVQQHEIYYFNIPRPPLRVILLGLVTLTGAAVLAWLWLNTPGN